MSNKKAPQYLVKTAPVEVQAAAVVAPPRYQPPPQPAWLLKHPLPQAKDASSKQPAAAALLVKQDSAAAAAAAAASAAACKPGYAGPGGGPLKPPYLGYAPYPGQQRRPFDEEARAPARSADDPSQRPAQPDDFNRVGAPQQQQHPQHRPQRVYPPTDDDFVRVPDMLKFVRKSDGDGARVAAAADAGRHVQTLVTELRMLKEANQRLADDNQELRDLCCFLDDDRQKGRKLAREWQRFGRYTASVMRQEVSAYQSKLKELDNKQQELIKDNLELKELCLYLDEERAGGSVCPSCGSGAGGGLRDDGDGSSSSTNADEPGVNNAPPPRRSASRDRLLHDNLARQRTTFNDQTMQYVRSLEQRVKQLEDEKRALQHKINQLNAGAPEAATLPLPIDTGPPMLSGRPEAVVRALQVLEVREQLEREGRSTERDARNDNMPDSTSPDMDDGEKALVREMCNIYDEIGACELNIGNVLEVSLEGQEGVEQVVVWRKLEEGPQPRR